MYWTFLIIGLLAFSEFWSYFSSFGKFSSVQSFSRVQFFGTPWTAAHLDSLSITNSRSSLKLMSIESMMPSTTSCSAIPFSSCLQTFPASESFQMKVDFGKFTLFKQYLLYFFFNFLFQLPTFVKHNVGLSLGNEETTQLHSLPHICEPNNMCSDRRSLKEVIIVH